MVVLKGSAMSSEHRHSAITRRDFVKSTALTGAGLFVGMSAMGQEAPGQETPPAPDPAELTLAIIGVGSQGRNLLTKCLKIPGIRFVAVAAQTFNPPLRR